MLAADTMAEKAWRFASGWVMAEATGLCKGEQNHKISQELQRQGQIARGWEAVLLRKNRFHRRGKWCWEE